MMIVEKMLNNAPNPLLHIADVSGSALFNADCMLSGCFQLPKVFIKTFKQKRIMINFCQVVCFGNFTLNYQVNGYIGHDVVHG